MKVSVIIVAAGNSTRMGGTNKQFLTVDEIPVLIRSIKAFDNINTVFEIIVVTNKNSITPLNELVHKYSFHKKIITTEGGETRQQSVFNGVKKASSNCNYIAIHDGARPLVKAQDIENVLLNAQKHKASTLGVPVKDTIKFVEKEFITDTPNRNNLYITQTPQVFEKNIYIHGIKNATANNLDLTDDCQLVEALGIKIFMTIGNYSNIKITTPEDIKLAELFLKEGY